jgi:holin-like protein
MKFIKQLSVILAVSFIAELMEYLIPLPVAASVYGLLLMLLGLVTKVIPLEKVEGAADFLVEIMPILFVPPTVSIMTSVEAMKQMLVPLCVISVVSTILIMVVTGRTAQAILRAERHGTSPQQGGKEDE